MEETSDGRLSAAYSNEQSAYQFQGLSSVLAAAGHPQEPRFGPMATPVRSDVADSWSPSELAAHHHNRVVQQPTVVQVSDQGMQRLVECRQQLAECLEVGPVGVPPVRTYRR